MYKHKNFILNLKQAFVILDDYSQILYQVSVLYINIFIILYIILINAFQVIFPNRYEIEKNIAKTQSSKSLTRL